MQFSCTTTNIDGASVARYFVQDVDKPNSMDLSADFLSSLQSRHEKLLPEAETPNQEALHIDVINELQEGLDAIGSGQPQCQALLS